MDPDGAKIRQLRMAKGLDAQTMADRAGFNVKTWSRIEEGRPCFICTVVAAAKALGRTVKVEDLLLGVAPPPMEKADRIVITRRGEFADLDETELVAFAEAIEKLIGAKYKIEVVKVEPGSIRITIKLHPDDAERFRGAARRGLLDQLDIIDAKDVAGPGEMRREELIAPDEPGEVPARRSSADKIKGDE